MDATTNPADASVIEIHSDSDGWWTNTPWWLVSAGLHLVILLGATLVSIERLMAVEETGIFITPAREKPQQLIGEQQRIDDFFRTEISKDDETRIDEAHFVFDPTAQIGDHFESNDNETFGERKGEDMKFHGYLWNGGPGINGRHNFGRAGIHDLIGTGGGAGRPGRFGGDRGGNKIMIKGPGRPTKESEEAVLYALKWLARHQNPDGSWGAVTHLNHCVGSKCAGNGDASYDAGLTGLALLAYLGAGYTHLSKEDFADQMNPGRTIRFGEVVKFGLKWLMTHQDSEGCIGGQGTKYMYNHTIAALALSEAYGMTATHSFKGPAQQAIDFIVAAQNPERAWRYTKLSGDNDTSVTGWAVMALKSAELSELDVPARQAYDGARKWIDEVTNPTVYSRAGYNSRDSGKVFVPGQNEQFEHHESMTAVAVLCRIFMSKDKNDPGLVGANLLLADLPQSKTNLIDYYYWYYASLALYQLDGPDGPKWKKWNGALMNAIVPHQKTARDGCAHGSWTSENDRWGFEGGRVYATAINALTLEVYYRYANVFRGSK
jgi:hypothetical protein